MQASFLFTVDPLLPWDGAEEGHAVRESTMGHQEGGLGAGAQAQPPNLMPCDRKWANETKFLSIKCRI